MAELLETLHSEHEMVKELFEKLKSEDQAKKKEQLFSQIKRDLTPHMRGEEKYFYPALKEKEGNKEDVLEAVEEHHAAKLLLNELDDMSPDEERWDAKASVLQEMIEHHIEEEEDTIFEAARDTLSEAKLRKIAEQFEKEKSLV